MTESVPLGATIEVDYYYERVAAALADLPPEARDELLEDLQAHFVEVLAEQGGPLVDRLGPPAMYAAELRAAAGLEAGAVRAADRAPIVVYYERFVAALPELDRRAGRIIGYPKATEFLRLLRPAWWIARAVAIVVLIFATDIVPADRFDDPIGWLFLAVATVVSIRIGATGAPRVPRWIGFAGTAVAVVGVLFVIANAPSLLRQYTSDAYYASSGGGPFDGVTNVFPVDEQGRSLQHITLYDQNGNAIQVGDYWRCTSGEGAVASYPLCLGIARPTPTVTAEPTDAPAPTATPSPGASASPSPGATVSPGGSPGGGPSLSPSANPSVSPSR
ncbi:hypothetical protein OHA72_13910 [Dactylosporangium sp. NBC_01737]|uniref:HAAS signaling domain-containing protein n=1 Tax=Dactylosporangium sp. NBC_01737 TaxID=2975959 RepID=UPI002E13B668|nr:hypothetical protein OHA72_13910 [Dactylosporangium sp. NBC_01737]